MADVSIHIRCGFQLVAGLILTNEKILNIKNSIEKTRYMDSTHFFPVNNKKHQPPIMAINHWGN
jgi:hypothetical protein